MALLQIIQQVTRRVGIAQPTIVIGNTDKQINQLLGIANEEGQELRARFQWSALVKQALFNQATQRDQGTFDSITGGDFDYITNQTMWNRTTSLPVLGPLSSVNWQTLQAFPVTGPYQQWMQRGQNLFFDPAPTSADQIAFDYYSKHWCQNAAGDTTYDEWNADTDTGLLSEELMALGIRWRWLKTKGLEYAEDFNTYERRVVDAMARDGGNMIESLEGIDRDYRQAGIVIPIGSWNV